MKEEIIDGIKYRLDEVNKTAEVTYLTEEDNLEDYAGDIIIPETVEFDEVTYRVTSIGWGVFDGCKLTSITIPNSVTIIRGGAFDGCDSLEKKPTQEIEINELDYRLLMYNHLAMVVGCSLNTETIDIPSEITYEGVPYRVISIGPDAFSDCESLTSITIPDSVTSIGENAFYFNYGVSLRSIVVAEGNTVYDSRENCNAIVEKATNTLICGCQNTTIPDSVTSIGDEAFYGCESLTSIIIPNSVKSIGKRAFYGCESLTSITIPDSVTSIGNSAFSSCDSLTSIVVSEGNTVYDSRENCNAIIETATNTLICGCQNTTIPDSVTSIGKSAFYGCESLTSITIPDSVTSIGLFAFRDCKALTSVTIPSSVMSIGEGGTFQGCTSLKLVQWNAINCTIDEVSEGRYYPPFHNLSSIKNFTFGNNVKSIPACLCCGLSGLTSISIPDSVTSIGKYAFKNCSSLKAIDIPDSVMIIEREAFWGCSSLKIIAIPSNVIIIEDSVFDTDYRSMIAIRYRGTVEQLNRRYRYWDRFFFHGKTVYCTDDDETVYF